MMNKEAKKIYVEEMKKNFNANESVMIAQYQGLNVNELDSLRKELRDKGILFKITKNRITKIAIKDTSKKDLEKFFSENLHLKFKLVFMDAGMYSVVKTSLPFFWERLTKGGIIIFDQYNCDQAPGETLAVDEFFKSMDLKIRTYPFTWMPTAYVVKS